MYHGKITRIGDRIGVTLPAEALMKLGLKEGDSVVVRDTPDGLQLGPVSAEDQRVFEAFEQSCAANHETLRRLAK